MENNKQPLQIKVGETVANAYKAFKERGNKVLISCIDEDLAEDLVFNQDPNLNNTGYSNANNN